MRYSGVLIAALTYLPQAICQSSLSSTSVVTCITTLGTTSVVPVPTTSSLRSLTIDSIQPSTFTPTATSTPPDITTTLTYTQFPTTTTTIANTEIDTFSTTTTLISALLITDTITTTVTSKVSQTTTTTPTSTVSTYPGFFPAASAQASQLASLAADYPNKKRSFGSRSPNKGSHDGAIGARQVSLATAVSSALSSSTASPSAYIYPKVVSCTGIVEYYSVTTKVVSTAPAVTTTLVPITDTTSTTETTTIISSVLSAPASTTETISATITTSSLVGTVTNTVVQTSTTTVTVQAAGAQATTYAACQSNNLVSTVKDSNYPINDLGVFLTFSLELGIAVATSASSAYACCVQGVTGVYAGANGGSAYLANTGTCYLFPDDGGCSPTTGYYVYSSCPADDGQEYTVSSADCGIPLLESPCS